MDRILSLRQSGPSPERRVALSGMQDATRNGESQGEWVSGNFCAGSAGHGVGDRLPKIQGGSVAILLGHARGVIRLSTTNALVLALVLANGSVHLLGHRCQQIFL